MTPHEKRELAYKLKQEGKSYSEISDRMGCAYHYAKVLVVDHEHRLAYQNSKSRFVRELTLNYSMSIAARITRCFISHFGHVDKIVSKKIAEMGAKNVISLDGVGPKSVGCIAAVLESIGVIKSAREWLAPVEQKLSHKNTDTLIRWIVQNVTDEDIPIDTSNGRALMYNLVSLARFGRSYKKYNNEPDQDKEIEELERRFKCYH